MTMHPNVSPMQKLVRFSQKGSRTLAHWMRMLVLVCILPVGSVSGQPPKALEVTLKSNATIVGLPVHWGQIDAAILEPDGRFHIVETDQVQAHRVLDRDFAPQSLPHARSLLAAELGNQFETVIAGPYVIAAPVGAARRWHAKFLALLSGYTRYAEVRGWQLRRPDFPLVVIVFRTRREFIDYCIGEGVSVPSQAVGSYFPRSNRCVLFQIADGGGTNWTETESTIIHEAVHQLAHNTGIHERLFENPLWLVEGLATMFEMPAVYDPAQGSAGATNRQHTSRLAQVQPHLADSTRFASIIESLVLSDDLFRQNATVAYSSSWAMTFYLSERMPREYGQLLRIQSEKGFGAYPPEERMRDYQESIGVPPAILAQQMQRFFAN